MQETGQADQLFWPRDHASFYRLFTKVGRSLGISLVPYSMRHSGVKIDRAVQT